jgi:hypothetical protein
MRPTRTVQEQMASWTQIGPTELLIHHCAGAHRCDP